MNTRPIPRPRPEAEPETPKAEAAAPKARKALYVVKGSDIWLSSGRVAEGSTVEMTGAEARHFVKIGRLAPYIPDDDGENLDD